jgi:sugar lactone lactonase YvrE
VEGRDDLLLAAFETGFALFAPEDGRIAWLDRPAGLGDGVRLNDGRVDPQGRFWAGSMMERSLGAGEPPRGTLYRVDSEGCAAPVVGGLSISNSLCWSPRSDRVYFADTGLGELYAAPFDARSGVFAGPRLLRRFEGEQPDGAVTDAGGDVWLALWGGGRVARLSPEGEDILSIPVDAPLTTCPAFGGPDGTMLFVSTARDGLTAKDIRAKPRSGALFVFETGARGWPQARARLSAGAIRL